MEIYGFGGKLEDEDGVLKFFPEEPKNRVSSLSEIRNLLEDLGNRVVRSSDWSFSDVLSRFI